MDIKQEQDNPEESIPNVMPIEEIITEEPFKEIETAETAVKKDDKPEARSTPSSGVAPKPSDILKAGFSGGSENNSSSLQAPKPTEILTKAPDLVGKKAIIKRPKNKIATVFGVVFVLLVAAFVAFFFFFYRVKITINTSPAPDKVVLDGKDVKPGTFNLMPGKHTIEISKNGYITYTDSRIFKVDETVNLDFKFEPAKTATLLGEKGYLPAITKDGNYIVFVASNGQLFSKKISDVNAAPIPLSNNAFTNVTDLFISNNGQFALLKDIEALKVVEFAKTDVINQNIAKLPPSIDQISSVTWNATKSDYFPEENSEIIYDLKTDSGWRLYLANRAHSQADILATLDPDNFSSLYLDWSENDKQVLLTGGEAGIIDLTTREYSTISKDAKFIFGKWGPQGQYAALIDDLGNLYRVKDGKVEKTEFKTKPELISFTANNKLVIVSGARPIEVNFDTLTSIDYAEIKGLETAQKVAVAQGVIYFQDNIGIEFAPLAFSSYQQK